MLKIRQFLSNESAATAIEYAFIALMIAVASVVAMGGLGDSLSDSYGDTASKANSAMNIN